VVFGPVYETLSKQQYGAPLGLEKLAAATQMLEGFPLLALGGISIDHAKECLEAGAAGIAGITLFDPPEFLKRIAVTLKDFAKGAV
jgi:thiamine-phosphate pyrophosphorylase